MRSSSNLLGPLIWKTSFDLQRITGYGHRKLVPWLGSSPFIASQRLLGWKLRSKLLALEWLASKMKIIFIGPFHITREKTNSLMIKLLLILCNFYAFIIANNFYVIGRRILRGSTTQKRLIFQLWFIMLKIVLYVCRILCENFIQIGQ